MDIPIDLSPHFVIGKDELRQSLILVLKNPDGSFMQDPRFGADFSIHSQQISEGDVVSTVQKIEGASVIGVKIEGEKIHLGVEYRGSIQNYQFSVK